MTRRPNPTRELTWDELEALAFETGAEIVCPDRIGTLKTDTGIWWAALPKVGAA